MNRCLSLYISLLSFMLVGIILDRGSKNKDDMKSLGTIKKVVVTTVAGDGTPGFVDGPVTAAKFRMPLDVAVHDDGTIYVADAFNRRIRKISGGMVTTFAGSGNRDALGGDGIEPAVMIPTRLALDKAGNIYTLDANDTIVRKITPTAKITIYAGTSDPGFKDGPMSTAQFGASLG